MLGAITGDVVGSVHEGSGTKTKDFRLFVEDSRLTDDTVLTVAVAERLLRGGSYIDRYHDYFHAYPQAGYGGSFIRWAGYRRRDPYTAGATGRPCGSARSASPATRWTRCWPRRGRAPR
jgi:ADP-ribosylglycohydrolase